MFLHQCGPDISDVSTQDGSHCITISQTVGDETVMIPGNMSYSEVLSNTSVNPNAKIKPTPAPKKTLNGSLKHLNPKNHSPKQKVDNKQTKPVKTPCQNLMSPQ